MDPKSRTARVVLLFAGSVLLAGALVLSYQSGCIFDAKQGIGDFAEAQRYDFIAGTLFFGSTGCFAIGAVLGRSRWDLLRLAFMVGGGISAATIATYFIFGSGLRGVLTCTPV
jgi:hypothetical protein